MIASIVEMVLNWLIYIPPDYGYTKGQNDYINKEKLKDCHLSNDYYRIYDCGQYKYEWKNVN